MPAHYDPKLGPMRVIPLSAGATLGDHRRYPGARLLLVCALCGWSKSYRCERVLRRLQELRTGGHATPLEQVARRVAWNCPACRHVKWRALFAWPAGVDAREVRRLGNLYRN